MDNFLKVASGMDFVPILLSLTNKMWNEDRFLKDHKDKVFKDVDSIILRYPSVEANRDPWESTDRAVFYLLPEARAAVFWLMARLQSERLGRVLINRMRSGSHIPPHVDIDKELAYYKRYHLVLQGSEKSTFRVGNEIVRMDTGDIWYFDNTKEHECRNEGTTDRIHLIVDCKVRNM
jgi:mannose-6-phosphate isomerase-like protein (cupin superfamily)